MKVKLLKKLRKQAKEKIYLSNSYTENNTLVIVNKHNYYETFYNMEFDGFAAYTIFHYPSIEEALPYLQMARRRYILDILHSKYRRVSKGQEKREEMERLKRENYKEYLRQF